MLKIKEAIVVEGNYDKIKLSSLVDATIIVTDGFMIFKNKKLLKLIQTFADKNGVIIFDDYAHHPSEIASSLRGLKKLCKGKLWCVYQPHTYSRTAGLFDEFCACFGGADRLIFAEIFAADGSCFFNLSTDFSAAKSNS